MVVSDKRKLMVDVSKMYYYYGMSQKKIASELGISRGYVCQLMDQARSSGIVEVRINDLLNEETELECHVRDLFGLEKVKIIINPRNTGTKLTDEVGKETCKYIDTIIKSDMIIAYSWGWTIYQISSNMVKHADIKNVTSVPFCGGTSNLEKNIYVSETSKNIADAYNGTPLIIPLPAVVRNAEIKNAICSDDNISSILDKCRNADIALFTVGSLGEENVLYRGGYVDSESMQRLSRENAVGDLCAHFINEYGEICDSELDERTISIDLENLRTIKNKICIATGNAKVKALLGVLRKKYVDVLITDEETIQSVLKLA
jgi:deoxyribonucleoside regulator